MGRFKIYASKNAGILEDYPTTNTGENEVAELWYGYYGLSRFLVAFDYSNYYTEYLANRAPHFSAATLTMNLYNAHPIFESYDLAIGTAQAKSVDLLLHEVTTEWDEGVGHDYVGALRETGFTNWYSARTTTNWTTSGGDYSTEVMRVSFDKGYENFSGSVSGTLNAWAMVTGTNYGYLLKYEDAYEALSGANKSISKFYTRHTNTIYEPYLLVEWNNQITDQRDEIVPGTTKKLYLYTKYNGTFSDPEDVSGVTISFSDTGITSQSYTGSSITNPIPGVYEISFVVPTGATAGTVCTDTWYVQYESGMSYTGIAQTSTASSVSSSWSQSDDVDPTNYWITTPDLQDEYTKGSRIYLDVLCRAPYTRTEAKLKTLEYKIGVENNGQENVYLDWDDVHYTEDGNFIYIDTQWFQTGFTYDLQFRYTNDGNLIYTTEQRLFKVV